MDWFFDVIGSISEEQSTLTPFLGSTAVIKSKTRMNLWGLGVDIHKRDDISMSSLGYKFSTSMGGSDNADFNNIREGSGRDFTIHTFSAMHSRTLDPNKVSRLSGTLRWIVTE